MKGYEKLIFQRVAELLAFFLQRGFHLRQPLVKRSHSDCWNIPPGPFSRSPHVLGWSRSVSCIFLGWCFSYAPRNSPWPGDSKWPFYPLVEGHLTFPKGHLTIPKRAQRIARGLLVWGGRLATRKVWKFFFRHFHKERFHKHWSCQAGHLK